MPVAQNATCIAFQLLLLLLLRSLHGHVTTLGAWPGAGAGGRSVGRSLVGGRRRI